MGNMFKLPSSLSSYQDQAEKFFKKGKVTEIIFSGPTYQVQVKDPKMKEAAWAFIQFQPNGKIKDCFCSCDTGSDTGGCVHIATALLKIYNEHDLPLHLRFKNSLWNRLCYIYADRLGISSKLLKQLNANQYYYPSAMGKQVFYINLKSENAKEQFEELLTPQQVTENTSLKFSNLSQEEIKRWREGHPSQDLQYELSFWSDLAKWMMALQENKVDYRISFEYTSTRIPNYVHIRFPDFEVGFYLSQANLPFIIPGLASVKSPLKVHNNDEEMIDKITYNPTEKALHVKIKEKANGNLALMELNKGIKCGDWIYVPDDGFYSSVSELLMNPIIKENQINRTLNDNIRTISTLLQGTELHTEPVKPLYHLYFDDLWNLHVETYLFQPGDLTGDKSAFFGNWGYIDGRGFYRLENVLFDESHLVIEQNKVAEFVNQRRLWLNTIPGFETHVISIENRLSYHLDEKDRLLFETEIDLTDKFTDHKDFGPWVYARGQGFYSKKSSYLSSGIYGGLIIEPFAISSFIKENREELKLIPKFFSSENPVESVGLLVDVDKNGEINIHPEYHLKALYKKFNVKFFDQFAFLPESGFYELPAELRLPDHYNKHVTIQDSAVESFLINDLPMLMPFIDNLDKKLQVPKTIELYADEIHVKEENNQLLDIMKVSYRTELGTVPATKLWKALSKHMRFVMTEAGLIDLQQMRFNWLHQIHKNQINSKSGEITLNTMEILRIDAFDEIHAPKEISDEAKNARQILQELKEFKTPDLPDLSGLDSHLRPYQQLGVNWLWFLYHHHLSGLLCDDMGLGKTHQAMALIAGVMNLKKKMGQTAHFLVVCPTSVLYHWQEKLSQFLPHARVCTFHGMKRSLGDFKKDYDILLTSYGIWRNDNQLLSQVPFEVAILDEVQVAKNYNSMVYASLLNIKAKTKIGLTGTPIENKLRELKSLFDIVLPNYMPHEKVYRELFVKPIEKEQNDKRRLLLSRYIKPFVLRRKKEGVLQDLPEKIEEVSHCALLPEQYKLYQQVLHQSKERLLAELRDESNPIPFIHIFALLSQLKQICNHPALYFKKPDEYKNFESGKWDLFQELLQEARDSQQKVVIFSQYLYMLDIMRHYFNERGIHFAEIRGATIDRGEQVRKFNQDPSCEVFLGSLQASGLGIDLTGGSVVIHYDRWWNAARENQATDRVHRIGQKRGVQVFKLVTKGTFEERIDALIEQKGKLMEDVVGVDEQQYIKQFNRKEIIQLLQDVELGKDTLQEKVSDVE